ncbi:MAG: ATP synthase F0 subunit B [Candidatus Calescibacterium sp.]|nr:ATP synthase F0 subunit B [Candidatus Calescibacterium sp.]MCX7971639.1 ATP synthase F0 subunit B [bacterium]MDW8195847.1 ATP synthase F0 subunit B [Candidatus Calescibacterium sp.]
MSEILSGWTLLLQIINFIVFSILAYFLFYKPFKMITEERRNIIHKNIQTAEEIRKDVEKIKQELEAKLNEIYKERERIIQESMKEAENIKNYIIEEAQNKANEIQTKALKEIELAQKKVIDEIKNTYIEIVSSLARGVLKEIVDPNINKKIIEVTQQKLNEIKRN